MQNFRKLKIWEKSLSLSKKIYIFTENFPKSELYGLVSQMRRASVSIGANIAEGTARKTKKDFSNFLTVALGSTSELDFLIELSAELNYIKKEQIQELLQEVDEIRRMIYIFRQKLDT